MSNWALELQQFDIVRVWIRGEANILADAPSRAPWESALAQHLPIPDMPVRDLVRMMYQDPDGCELLVEERREKLLGKESEWVPLEVSSSDVVEPSEWLPGTPKFGSGTPSVADLMEAGQEAAAVMKELGGGQVLYEAGPVWPCFPSWVATPDTTPEGVRVGKEGGKPVPVNRSDWPCMFQKIFDDRGRNFVVRWRSPVLFTDGERRRSLWFNVSELGEEEAERQAWEYFNARFLDLA